MKRKIADGQSDGPPTKADITAGKEPVARKRESFGKKTLVTPSIVDEQVDFRQEPSTAMARWSRLVKLMTRAKKGHLPSISSLNLFAPKVIDSEESGFWVDLFPLRLKERQNYETSLRVFLPMYRNSVKNLLGFDNTGNVRLWSGGEALALYLLYHPEMIARKNILELGAGFLGLPSLACLGLSQLTITDGNEESVHNVEKILDRISNQASFTPPVNCRKMLWGSEKLGRFDVILAADCVFFEDHHLNFIQTLYDHCNGCTLLCSPPRKESLSKFLQCLRDDGRLLAKRCLQFDKFLSPLLPLNVDCDTLVPQLYIVTPNSCEK